MKTLDEVIKALEFCQQMTSRGDHCNECPYAKKDEYNDWTFDCNDSEVDALHYLQEYRKQKDLVGFLHAHIQAIEEDYQELRNAEKYPNILFRPEGMYCAVCGSRLDQDPEEEK